MLELKHISKTYKTSKGVKTQALKNINLKFPKKGLVFVLGKSGSGKSTLLNIIGGLDQADEGEIIINGKSSKDFSQADYDSYRNTYVGFIFQEFNLMDEYTIEKNIALALQLQQKEPQHDEIEMLLEKLGLGGYAGRYPNELSGGQKQRVAIARALVKSPEILMADEPTGALDSSTGKEIFDTLKELSKEKLVIVVSHDRESAQTYADRIIEFKDGEIDSDNAPEVEVIEEEFQSIRSHLPFKDSFKLGFSCLGHKKIRMVFTILLTSFALLTMALSDAVGNFNDVNAQYKAMDDNHQSFIGMRYQYINKDGNTMYSYGDIPLKQEYIDTILKDNNARTFARKYSSNEMRIGLNTLGIETLDLTAFQSAVESYHITEMKNFADLNYTDVAGTYPKNLEEVAISSYLADIILSQGIMNKDGNMVYPASNDDILGKIQINVSDRWLTISGIINEDYSAFASLKDIKRDQMDTEMYKTYRQFSQIVNMNSDKLFVQEGFVDSLKLAKNNVLQLNGGNIVLKKSDNDYNGLGTLAYPNETMTYFDGEKIVTTESLNKNEIIISPETLMYLLQDYETFYSDAFQKKSSEEQYQFITTSAKRMVGKSVNLSAEEYYDSEDKLFDLDVKIIGVVLPELADFNLEDMMRGGESHFNYASKELIEPHIHDTIYVSELLTSVEGADAQKMLETYSLDKGIYAYTFVTDDVKNIQSFAQFATKVFFYASIAFFIFAAVLMMNFIVVSISYRKKDIGILRAIGARSTDVLKIFVWEGVALAVISYIVTLVSVQGIAIFVNRFAANQMGMMISPIIITLRQPILLLGIVALVTFLACAWPVTRIARQRPIDAIKK